MEYEITFDESCIYDHGDNDQWDWNKLIGVKSCYFNPQKDSLMVGWRWNTIKDRLELTYYYHDNEEKAWFNDRGVFFINKAELKDSLIITMQLGISITELTIESRNFKYTTAFKSPIGETGWLIRDWFGGQKAAPHTMIKEIKKRI